MAFESIKRHPVVSAIIAVCLFVFWYLPTFIATLWPALVKDKTIPQWLAERRWPFLTTALYNVLTVGVALAVTTLLVMILVATRRNRVSSAPTGPSAAVHDPLFDLAVSEVRSEWAKLDAGQKDLVKRILISGGLSWDQIDDAYWKTFRLYVDSTLSDYLLERSTLLESTGEASLFSYIQSKKTGKRDWFLGTRTWKVRDKFRDALEEIIRDRGNDG